MHEFAQTLELKDDPELIAEYIEYHKNVWPEVLEALRTTGIESMKIYLHGNRMFMIARARDGFDPKRDYQAFTANPKAREWDELMKKYQQRVPGASEDEWWSSMTLVFDLDD